MRADEQLLARTRSLDPLIRGISGRLPLLAAVTPKNAAREQARLLEAWGRGEPVSPRWEPPELDRRLLSSARLAIDEVLAGLRAEAGDAGAVAARRDSRTGWLAVYHDRFVELARDLAVIDAAFTPRLAAAAGERFGAPEDERRAADALARSFRVTRDERDERDERVGEELVPTDDPSDPRSLLSRMRARLSELRLPVRVLARERVGSLAAAGDGVVIVAANKRASVAEIERVVVHEIDGHVLPRERGRAGRFGIETLGSASASEDEEGRALLLEEQHGLLSGQRRRSLAARHVGCRLVDRGATYVDVARELRSIVPLEEALSITSRVMRGGHARGGLGGDVVSGIARERVYLTARVRLDRARENDPDLLDRLGARRLSLAATTLVR